VPDFVERDGVASPIHSREKSMNALRRRAFFLAIWLGPAALIGACGARTGLLAPPYDAGLDVLPALDVAQTDAVGVGCPDAGETLVYAVAQSGALLSFYPPTAAFSVIGVLACDAKGAGPYSMAVDRTGTAYVEYDNGLVFQVSTATASCEPTSFVPQNTFTNFGMGYVVVGAAPNEELFLVSTGGALGTLDTMSFMVDEIAVTQPKIPSAELTGTGDGHLYAYYASGNTGGSTIAELDPMTGQVIAADPIAADRGTGWAFAFWGGDFWIFTTPASEQTTLMYDPVAKTSTVVAHYGSSIVGAGVSTCAPQ
jgi:hypothetical protein